MIHPAIHVLCDMHCMFLYEQSTYSTFSIQFLHLSLHTARAGVPYFSQQGVHIGCVGTKRIYLQHRFNNLQPARLASSVLAEHC